MPATATQRKTGRREEGCGWEGGEEAASASERAEVETGV